MFVEQEVYESAKLNKEHALTAEELWKVVANKKPISKLILLRAFALQLEIWKWLHRWKESTMLETVNELSKIASSMDEYERVYDSYIEKQNLQKSEKE